MAPSMLYTLRVTDVLCIVFLFLAIVSSLTTKFHVILYCQCSAISCNKKSRIYGTSDLSVSFAKSITNNQSKLSIYLSAPASAPINLWWIDRSVTDLPSQMHESGCMRSCDLSEPIRCAKFITWQMGADVGADARERMHESLSLVNTGHMAQERMRRADAGADFWERMHPLSCHVTCLNQWELSRIRSRKINKSLTFD